MKLYTTLQEGITEEDLLLYAPYLTPAFNKWQITKDTAIAFDIETAPMRSFDGTWDDAPESICYLWQLHIDGHPTIIGRTIQSFVKLLNDVLSHKHCTIWVHSLSYEWQFLRAFIAPSKVFLRSSRRVQSFNIGHATFQCSAIMSGSSLDKFLRDMSVPEPLRKQSGELFDYREPRTPETPLTEFQLLYARNDVYGLCEALKRKCANTGYSISTLPRTSTGFVRADVKNALGYTKKVNPLDPLITHDASILQALQKCFRGGNTHANRAISGQWLTGVTSYDRKSSYPAVMMSYKFPQKIYMIGSQFIKGLKLDWGIEEAMNSNEWYMYHVRLLNVRLKRGITIPYISYTNQSKVISRGVCKDNGRVLSASMIDMYITHIDLAIINRQYDFTIDVMAAWGSVTEMLPSPMRDCIMQYFDAKCKLKHSDPVTYMESKAKLNSIYGMTAQSPFMDNWTYDGCLDDSGCDVGEGTEQQTFPYQWAVQVTALARAELELGIMAIEGNYPFSIMCYTDTDSIKFYGEMPPALTELINARDKLADDLGLTIGDQRLGTWEHDAGYDDFITYGAKKYVVRHGDEWEVTVAGVNKKAGSAQIHCKEDVELNMAFEGKLVPKYFDSSEGCSVTLCDMPYTLSITDDYRNLIEFPHMWDLTETNIGRKVL